MTITSGLILTSQVAKSRLNSNTSHLGGLPDLPITTPWPVDTEGLSMGFIGQLNLADFATAIPSLPNSGLLLFFMRESHYLSDDPANWRVLYQPSQEDMMISTAPEDLAYGIYEIETLSITAQNVSDPSQILKQYGNRPCHQLMGTPLRIALSALTEVCNDAYEDIHKTKTVFIKDWLLLFHVDETDGMYGGLYWLIRQEDLKNHNFNHVWLVFDLD